MDVPVAINSEDDPPHGNHLDEGGDTALPTTVRFRRPQFLRNPARFVPEPVKSSLLPPKNRGEWLDFLLMKLPIIKWVWGYKFNYFVGDIIAGITVAIMHIPQGLAYALLANVDPIYGLYASFVPVLVYSVLGTSRHISVGTFAVVQLMIGNSVERIFEGNEELSENCMEGNSSLDFFFNDRMTTCGEVKVDVVITLALMTGLIMFVMGVLQLGFITIFMSDPLISGYTTGAATHVFTSQLQHITGLGDTIRVPGGLFKIPRTWIAMFRNISFITPATIIISIVAIVFLIIFKILNKLIKSPKARVPVKVYSWRDRKWSTKKFPWPVPIPSQLIVVIVATIVAYAADFEKRFNVIPIGEIPNGLPGITVPKTEFMSGLFLDAFVISIVLFSVSVSVAKVLAREHGYTINSNQEFLAYGLMNIIGCFFSSFTASGSLSRSSVQSSAGGKTQLVGFISSLIILVVLVRLGTLFEHLPRAILAAVIWVALYGMFKQFKDIPKYFKLCVWDAVVWVVVFLATFLLGVDVGLGVGIGISLLVIVIRIILPASSAMGQAHETEASGGMDNFENVESIPGIVIFRFQAPVCFVNSRCFRLRLEIACHILNKTGLKLNRNTEGCLQTLCYKARITHRGSYNVAASQEDITATYNANNDTVNIRSPQDAISDISDINHLSSFEPIHTVVIDCAPIGFMDSVGVKTMQEIVTDFDKLGIQVLFVCMSKENRDIMGRFGFFKKCSKKWLFPSMLDAIRHAQYEPALHPSSDGEQLVSDVSRNHQLADDNSSSSVSSDNEVELKSLTERQSSVRPSPSNVEITLQEPAALEIATS